MNPTGNPADHKQGDGPNNDGPQPGESNTEVHDDGSKYYCCIASNAFKHWWKRNFTTQKILAVGTVVIALFAVLTYCQIQDTFKEDRRAWLAPLGFRIPDTLAIERGGLLEIPLVYANVGKEPARRMRYRFDPTVMKRTIFTNREETERFIAQTAAGQECRDLVPKQAGLTIFPGILDHYSIVVGFDRDELQKHHAKSHFLAVVGCFAYHTITGDQITRFCAVIEPIADPPPNTPKHRTAFCRAHNDAR